MGERFPSSGILQPMLNRVLVFSGQRAEDGHYRQLEAARLGLKYAQGCKGMYFTHPSWALDFFTPRMEVRAVVTSVDWQGHEHKDNPKHYPGIELIDKARELGNIPVALFNDDLEAAAIANQNPDIKLLPQENQHIASELASWLAAIGVAKA